MKSEMECARCFCDSLFHQLGKLDVSPESKIAVTQKVMRMIAEADFNQPPPLIAAKVNEIVSDFIGKQDRFRKEKGNCSAGCTCIRRSTVL